MELIIEGVVRRICIQELQAAFVNQVHGKCLTASTRIFSRQFIKDMVDEAGTLTPGMKVNAVQRTRPRMGRRRKRLARLYEPDRMEVRDTDGNGRNGRPQQLKNWQMMIGRDKVRWLVKLPEYKTQVRFGNLKAAALLQAFQKIKYECNYYEHNSFLNSTLKT